MKDFDFQEAKRTNYDFVIHVQDDTGFYTYPNLIMAKANFPTLDPMVNGKDFTWGMYGGFDETYKRHAMRFESWSSYERLSR